MGRGGRASPLFGARQVCPRAFGRKADIPQKPSGIPSMLRFRRRAITAGPLTGRFGIGLVTYRCERCGSSYKSGVSAIDCSHCALRVLGSARAIGRGCAEHGFHAIAPAGWGSDFGVLPSLRDRGSRAARPVSVSWVPEAAPMKSNGRLMVISQGSGGSPLVHVDLARAFTGRGLEQHSSEIWRTFRHVSVALRITVSSANCLSAGCHRTQRWPPSTLAALLRRPWPSRPPHSVRHSL
jgi:DNA-directed RNA polymerase subunit RPC12/RpoP